MQLVSPEEAIGRIPPHLTSFLDLGAEGVAVERHGGVRVTASVRNREAPDTEPQPA